VKSTSLRAFVLASAYAFGALSCGPRYEEPEVLERQGDGKGDAPVKELPPYVHDAGEFVFPEADCCPVRFALAEQGEAAVALMGFGPPLRPDVPMVLNDGAWEAVVCMPRSTQLYGYRAYFQADTADAGYLAVVTHNPNAPSVMSVQYGRLNEFSVGEDAESCSDLDVAPHGDTTVAEPEDDS
jgi:hypothetical protein